MKKAKEAIKPSPFHPKANQRFYRQSSLGEDLIKLASTRQKILQIKSVTSCKQIQIRYEYSKTAGNIFIEKLLINLEKGRTNLGEEQINQCFILQICTNISYGDQRKTGSRGRTTALPIYIQNIEQLLVSKAKRLCQLMASEQCEKLPNRRFEGSMHKLCALQKII